MYLFTTNLSLHVLCAYNLYSPRTEKASLCLVSRYTFLVTRFSLHVPRYTLLVTRSSLHVSRYTLLVTRFSLEWEAFSIQELYQRILDLPADLSITLDWTYIKPGLK